MKKVLITFLLTALCCNAAAVSEDGLGLEVSKKPRSILGNITFVKEPWSGLCFAYYHEGNYHRGYQGLAEVPCDSFRKGMGPLPTISVYQYETVN